MTDEVEKHVLEKYELLEKKGKGAYGVVWKAVQRKTGKVVAVKKVFGAFQNQTDAQRTFREVMYLKHLQGHPNVVKLCSVIKSYNKKDLYLIFEYMEGDLHSVIRAEILSEPHHGFVIYQILLALRFVHASGVVHRDLKPANVLLDASCRAKLADFGLARAIRISPPHEIGTEAAFFSTPPKADDLFQAASENFNSKYKEEQCRGQEQKETRGSLPVKPTDDLEAELRCAPRKTLHRKSLSSTLHKNFGELLINEGTRRLQAASGLGSGLAEKKRFLNETNLANKVKVKQQTVFMSGNSKKTTGEIKYKIGKDEKSQNQNLNLTKQKSQDEQNQKDKTVNEQKCNSKSASKQKSFYCGNQASDEKEECMTEYIATRWYRAPEIILGSNTYDAAVDLWSVGCVLAEMLLGRPLFDGKSTFHQVELIFHALARFTSRADLAHFTHSTLAQRVLAAVRAQPLDPASLRLQTLQAKCSSDAFDFLLRTLALNPRSRITVEEALNHPFLARFRKQEDFLRAARSHLVMPVDENVKLSTEQYQKVLFQNLKDRELGSN